MNFDLLDLTTAHYRNNEFKEKNNMKLIGRKIYLNVEYDKWLTDNFGAQRERSRAVDLALRDFIMKVERNKKKLTVETIDLDLVK